MPDGRQNYDTKEVSKFAGLCTFADPSKEDFPESDSPFLKNVLNLNGILEARPGRSRVNATRYDSTITSLVGYVDRSGVRHTVFTVESVAVDPAAPDGTIQETH